MDSIRFGLLTGNYFYYIVILPLFKILITNYVAK